MLHHSFLSASLGGSSRTGGSVYGGIVFPGGKGIMYTNFLSFPDSLKLLIQAYTMYIKSIRSVPGAEMKVNTAFS